MGFGRLHIQGSLCMPNTTFIGINYMPWKYGAQYGHEQPVSGSMSQSPFNPQHTWCINRLWASGLQIWIWSVHGLVFSCSAMCLFWILNYWRAKGWTKLLKQTAVVCEDESDLRSTWWTWDVNPSTVDVTVKHKRTVLHSKHRVGPTVH